MGLDKQEKAVIGKIEKAIGRKIKKTKKPKFGDNIYFQEEDGHVVSLTLRKPTGDTDLTPRDLPEEIAQLPMLKFFAMSELPIVSLPDSIGTIRFQLNACKCLA